MPRLPAGGRPEAGRAPARPGSTTRSWRAGRDRELRADAYVTFALNPDGTIEQVRMAPTSPAVDFSFDFQDLLLTPVRAEAAGTTK
jgi:hypothetical protein